jgi:two-component system, sporulation sensor kinase B
MSWNLLLQFFFVLIPSYLYSLFMFSKYYKRNYTPNRYLIGGLCGLFGLLCMQQPALVYQGHQWDLHWTLLVLSFMLGGLTAGWVSLSIFVLYHIVTGWEFFFFDAGLYVLLLIPSIMIAERVYQQSMRKAVLHSGLISAYIAVMNSAVMMIYYITHNGAVQSFSVPEGAVRMMLLMIVVSFVSMVTIIWQIRYLLQYYNWQQKIQKSEQLHLISELAASVAHEVRNPLQVTRGFLQLSLKLCEGKQKDYLDIAIGELDRAEEIISAFLDFAKPKVEKMERIEAGSILGEVSQMMQSYSHLNGAKLSYAYTPDLYVLVDTAKLKQVLINLLKNAIEAAGENGEVCMSVNSGEGEVQIRISDNGEGMTEEQINQLGLPFYTSKQKGTGLGVMVSKRIVEAMKGRISYTSRLGAGTEVLVCFPQDR